MSEPFKNSLGNIEKRLEDLTIMVNKNQENILSKSIIDNDEFQKLFKISNNTAGNWRKQGLVAFIQINNKIFYKIEDINIMLDKHYRSFKK
jgi:hypothetical protein